MKIESLGRIVWILAYALIVFGGLYGSKAIADASGITGYHGNTSSCTACHNANAFAASASINAPTSVLHDALSGTFTLLGSGGTSRGFNIAIYNPSAAKVSGGFSILSSGVKALSGELTHIGPQSIISWTFRWTAPSTLGTYTAYACVNPVDNMGSELNDGNAACNTDTLTVTNNNPNAINDFYAITVGEDSGLSGTFNVLSNDLTTEGDAFSWFTHSTGSVTGILQHNGSGVYQYNPNGLFESLDSGEFSTTNFTYTIRENNYTSYTDTATSTIRIDGANDAPVANNETITVAIAGTATTLQDGSTTSVLTNDTDVDIENLTAVLVTDVLYGTLTLNSDGTFSYTHDGSGNLGDSFTYRANDGTTNSNLATVTISVANTAPTAVDDLLVAIVVEGGSVNFTVLGNDTDPETSVIAVVGISSETNGTAVVQGDESITFNHDGSESSTASFQYTASDGFLTSNSATVTLTVTPVNDPPIIGPVGNLAGTEDSLLTIIPTVNDPDDANDGSGLSWSFVSGQQVGMSMSSTGVITWTPPLGPPAVFGQTYPIVIGAADGGEDGAAADTESFTITINPPDADSDIVADYDDFCVTVSDPTNADNDNDGTAGTDGLDANSGGDVCDLDDDNDGMPDVYENTNGFNQFDAADAAQDADGDGVSNLDEFLNSTNPNISDQTIDATGYWTPFTLTPPDPTVIDSSATGVVADNYGPYRPGKNIITWTASNSVSSNLGTASQTLNIRPIVNFGADQLTAEGNSVTVTATINGNPVAYPVGVNYSVAGSSDSGDHDAASGSFDIISPNRSVSITVNVSMDVSIEGDETAVFTIDSATNAVPGSNSVHTLTIVERNVAPLVELQFQQGGQTVGSAYVSEGNVDILATISDPNPGQVHSLDWSGSDNSLVPPTNSATANWTFAPVAGNYIIDLIVTDNGFPGLSTQVTRLLNIAATAPTLTAVDTDGDGVNDDVEGYGDADNDGVPDYLDASSIDGHMIPNQTVDLNGEFLIETEPGLVIATGSTARASNIFGVMLSDTEVGKFGSNTGDPPLNADDSNEHIGGVYDFEIRGLIPGSSSTVVIPLQSSIPTNAVYRKFDSASGWKTFSEDSNNQVASAIGEPGACPEPGSSEYRSGLNFLDNCIQLTIEDGGGNDADNTVNGVIRDPGAVGVDLNDPVEPTVEGSGRLGALFLAWLVLLAGFSLLIKTRKRRDDKTL